jgi:hypothetical protein
VALDVDGMIALKLVRKILWRLTETGVLSIADGVEMLNAIAEELRDVRRMVAMKRALELRDEYEDDWRRGTRDG